MIGEAAIVLSRYAQAFFNVFADQINDQHCIAMKKAVVVLRANSMWLTFFDFPHITFEQQQMIVFLLKKLGLPDFLQPLCELLCLNKRMMLFSDVLEKIVKLFFDRHEIMEFTIASFPELDSAQLQALHTFLQEKSGKTVRYTCMVDDRLIAGIRAQSASLLWEYSVAKKLREARQMALNRE